MSDHPPWAGGVECIVCGCICGSPSAEREVLRATDHKSVHGHKRREPKEPIRTEGAP